MASIDYSYGDYKQAWTAAYNGGNSATYTQSPPDLEKMIESNTKAITKINSRLEDLANLLETIDESLQVIAGRSA